MKETKCWCNQPRYTCGYPVETGRTVGVASGHCIAISNKERPKMSRRLQYLRQGNTLYLTGMTWVGAAEEEPRKKEDPVEYKILPELKKLDTLDQQERLLTDRLNKGQIGGEDFDNIMNAMDVQREALIKRLEKKGYFPKEPGEYCEPAGNERLKKAPLSYDAKVAIGIIAFAAVVVIKMVTLGP